MTVKTSDAEQAKQTGGMIGLWPSPESASKLYVPGGEPLEDLHCTLIYFGEDVSHLSPLEALSIMDIYHGWPAFRVRAFAHATFNPDAVVGDPCAVYLLGNSPDLADFQQDLTNEVHARYGDALKDQHLPWIPHTTAGYGLRGADLGYTGEIVLDRLVLKWQGDTFTTPLG